MKLKADESSEPWESLEFSGKNTENVGRTKWEKDVWVNVILRLRVNLL